MMTSYTKTKAIPYMVKLIKTYQGRRGGEGVGLGCLAFLEEFNLSLPFFFGRLTI